MHSLQLLNTLLLLADRTLLGGAVPAAAPGPAHSQQYRLRKPCICSASAAKVSPDLTTSLFTLVYAFSMLSCCTTWTF